MASVLWCTDTSSITALQSFCNFRVVSCPCQTLPRFTSIQERLEELGNIWTWEVTSTKLYQYTLSQTFMVNEVERTELSWSSSLIFLNTKVRITWIKVNSKAIVFLIFKRLNYQSQRTLASISVRTETLLMVSLYSRVTKEISVGFNMKF